jgi:hypothetical protein
MPEHRTVGIPTRSETPEIRSERKTSGNPEIRKKGAGPIYRLDTKEDLAGQANPAEYNNEGESEADAESDTGSNDPRRQAGTGRGYGNADKAWSQEEPKPRSRRASS